MIDHFGIVCGDFAASRRFYDDILAVLDARRILDYGTAIGYGSDHPTFWINDAAQGPEAPTTGTHIAFAAPSAAKVQVFFRTALALGAEPLHEPRLWPEYHDSYYGAFVRDPDGNNVEAVFHGGGPGA